MKILDVMVFTWALLVMLPIITKLVSVVIYGIKHRHDLHSDNPYHVFSGK